MQCRTEGSTCFLLVQLEENHRQQKQTWGSTPPCAERDEHQLLELHLNRVHAEENPAVLVVQVQYHHVEYPRRGAERTTAGVGYTHAVTADGHNVGDGEDTV